MKLTGLQKEEAGVIISASIQDIEALKKFDLNIKNVAQEAIKKAVLNCETGLENILIESAARILYTTGTFSYSSGHTLEEVYKVIAVVFNSLTPKKYNNQEAFDIVRNRLQLELYEKLESQAAALIHDSSKDSKSIYSVIEQNKFLSQIVTSEILEELRKDYAAEYLPF